MLDYKIKELRRDIAPREMEIGNLKKQTNELDKKLKRFNNLNSNLGYIVDDLRTRQEKMQELIKKNRGLIRSNNTYIQNFKNDVYKVVQYIDDFDQLKRAVNQRLYKYVQQQAMKNAEIDPDIKKEYENQKKFLENSVHSLKKRLEKESEIHKEDNLAIMSENIILIKQINLLRQTVRELDVQLKVKKNEFKEEFTSLSKQQQAMIDQLEKHEES